LPEKVHRVTSICRNLSTKTRMFELLLQTFWAKKTL
jgi:hypothetical protein